jgi:hypothetical protein
LAIEKAIADNPVKKDAWVRRQLELEIPNISVQVPVSETDNGQRIATGYQQTIPAGGFQ